MGNPSIILQKLLACGPRHTEGDHRGHAHLLALYSSAFTLKINTGPSLQAALWRSWLGFHLGSRALEHRKDAFRHIAQKICLWETKGHFYLIYKHLLSTCWLPVVEIR